MGMTLRQVKNYSREAWRKRQEDWRMQLFIARMAQADEKAYQEARRLLETRSEDTST